MAVFDKGWPRPVIYGLYLFVLATAMVVAHGFQYLAQGADSLAWSRAWTGLFVLTAIALGWRTLSPGIDTVDLTRRHAWLGSGLMTASFVLTLYMQSDVIAPLPWWVAAGLSAGGAQACFRRWGARGAIAAHQVLGLVLLIVMIRHYPWPWGGRYARIWCMSRV